MAKSTDAVAQLKHVQSLLKDLYDVKATLEHTQGKVPFIKVSNGKRVAYLRQTHVFRVFSPPVLGQQAKADFATPEATALHASVLGRPLPPRREQS